MLGAQTLPFEMAQKKKKCVSSHGHENLANRKAPNKKKSIINTKKSNQIISNGEEEATQKFNKKKKKKSVRPYQISGKSIVESSNDNTDQMEIDQVIRIYLQEEIMMDILSRLPVRSLLRFKCVSKFWNSLINDTYFRMKHYIHSRNDQNSQKFLITESFYDKNDVYNFSTSSLLTVQVVQDEQKLDCPSSCKPTNVILFCSCDGLVLIFVSSRGLYDSSARLYEELLLWNPSTRESILLPHPEFRVVYCVCGLGYDATSEDYKILEINVNADHSFDTSIEVLSLKSGSWRRIGYPTVIERVTGFKSCGMDYLAFLHGAFHWLGMSLSGYYTTVSFNISNEVYGEVPLLEQMYHVCPSFRYIDRGVSVLRGMLCFHSTYNYWEMGMDCTFKLWIMNDYGVRESWTNFIKIQDTNLFIQPDQNICLRIVKCYYIANVSDVFVLQSRHLEDHLDYTTLNVNVLPLSKELLMLRA